MLRSFRENEIGESEREDARVAHARTAAKPRTVKAIYARGNERTKSVMRALRLPYTDLPASRSRGTDEPPLDGTRRRRVCLSSPLRRSRRKLPRTRTRYLILLPANTPGSTAFMEGI